MIQNKFTGSLKFGLIDINSEVVFYYRKFVFAIVNIRQKSIKYKIRQQAPGHVLVIPTRVEKRYSRLSEIEAMELWISAKNIGNCLKRFYNVNKNDR